MNFGLKLRKDIKKNCYINYNETKCSNEVGVECGDLGVTPNTMNFVIIVLFVML